MKRTPPQPQTIDLVALVKDSRVLKPPTKRNYLRGVNEWLAFAGDSITGWTPATAQRFYEHLLNTRTTNAANLTMWGINYALKRVEKTHETFKNPIRSVEILPAPAREKAKRALTPSEGKRLLLATGGSDIIALRDRAILLLFFFTGMRRSSIVSLYREGIEIHPNYALLTAYLKGGSNYKVPISNHVYRLLEPYLEQLGNCPTPPTPLFPAFSQPNVHSNVRLAGTRMTEDGLYKAMKIRGDTANIPDFHPHMLRHTFITWCIEGGIPEHRVAVITGHKGAGPEGGGSSMIRRVYTDYAYLGPAVADEAWKVISRQLGVG